LSHWLPAIDIAIKGDRALFLDEVAALARVGERFKVERLRDCVGIAGYHAINLHLCDPSPHQDLVVQFLSPPETPAMIRVELSAGRWSPDPATNAIYVDMAKTLVGPLLSAWNKQHGDRYRMRIERPGRNRFIPSERTDDLLNRFAVLANTSSLHPLDWNRFYQLVREGRQKIPVQVLRTRLIGAGFSADKADDLAQVYGHLWAYKQLR